MLQSSILRSLRCLRSSTYRNLDRLVAFVDRLSWRGSWRGIGTDFRFENEIWEPQAFFDRWRSSFSAPEEFFLRMPILRPCASLISIRRTACGTVSELILERPRSPNHSEQNLIPIRYLRADRSANDACVIVLTGWWRKSLLQEERFCAPFLCNGFDVVLISAPYSQERTPVGYRSGELFITPDLYACVENIQTCVMDTVAVLKWLELRGVRHRVLLGLSLGGILMQIVASTCRAEGLILIMAGANLSLIVWDGLATQDLKHAYSTQGISRENLALAWAICDPMNIGAACKVAKERILLFTSKYDLIMPLACQELLWRALDEPRRVELCCSHYGIVFHIHEIQHRMLKFLQAIKPA